MNSDVLKAGFSLLDKKEKRSLFFVIFVVIISGILSALMVASLMPFLESISNTNIIFENKNYLYFYNLLSLESEYEFIIMSGIFALTVIVIATLTQVYKSWVVAKFVMYRIHSLAEKILRSYLVQTYDFFVYNNVDDLGANILSETQQAVSQFFRPIINLISSLFSAFCIVIYLMIAIPKLALSVLFVLLVLYAPVVLFTKRLLKNYGEERLESNKKRFSIANDMFLGIKYIKLAGLEKRYLDIFSKPSKKMSQAQSRAVFLSEFPNFALQGIVFAGMIVLVIIQISSFNVTDPSYLGTLLPSIGVLAFAGQKLIPEIQRIYNGYSQSQYGYATILNLQKQIENRLLDENTNLYDFNNMQFKNISFSYKGSKTNSIQNVSVDLNKGDKIAIIGKSGSGKSTLVDLISGLLKPSEGSIFLNGKDIKKESIAMSLIFDLVPQDPMLIERTILSNITQEYEIEKINYSYLMFILKIVGLTKFANKIDLLKEIGKNGVSLSGGERQRVSIARALYRDMPIIIMDEATSALDDETETSILMNLESNMADKTILFITHKNSNLKYFNKVWSIDNGNINIINDSNEV